MQHPLKSALAAAVVALGLPQVAQAAPVTITSYSMPNGDGRSTTGVYNYWDRSYTGTGDSNIDGAPLSGGTGDLTDGIIASGFWNVTENVAGTGPYVGWRNTRSLNPLITFNFDGDTTINAIRIHIDNSQDGSVRAPADILINGASLPFTAPPGGTIGFIDFTGLNEFGSSLTLQFFQNTVPGNGWVFVSEVSFNGVPNNAVPEPASWAMLIAGFGLTGAVLRRRRQAGAALTFRI
jgi:hypothetical protein